MMAKQEDEDFEILLNVEFVITFMLSVMLK